MTRSSRRCLAAGRRAPGSSRSFPFPKTGLAAGVRNRCGTRREAHQKLTIALIPLLAGLLLLSLSPNWLKGLFTRLSILIYKDIYLLKSCNMCEKAPFFRRDSGKSPAAMRLA